MPINLLGRRRRRMNITTDGHRVRATGCMSGYQISRLTYKAMHRARESVNTLAYIYYECPFHEKLTR